MRWNNLANPLEYQVTAPEGTVITPATGKGVQLKSETDGDPREFLVDVKNWNSSDPLTVKVSYVVCSKADNSCVPVRQEYQISLAADPAGGRVNGRTHQPGGQAKGGAGKRGQGKGQGKQGKGKKAK